MSLTNIIKKHYDSISGFVNKERSYFNAAVLASAAVATDAITTYIPMTKFPDYAGEGLYQAIWSTQSFMNYFGTADGLIIESLLTLGVALPLTYALNKITRREWTIGKKEKDCEKMHFFNYQWYNDDGTISNLPSNGKLRKSWGTIGLYALSITSLFGALNNLYFYISGILKFPALFESFIK